MDFKNNLNFKAADRAVEAGATEGLAAAAERVLEVSNSRAPRETGALIASGRVSTDGLEAAVVYDADYAPIVHERMDLAHDDGEAKFLESAQASERAAVAQAIAASIRRRT